MKRFQGKLPSTWALTTILLLTGFELFSPSSALAEQPSSTLERRVQRMEAEIRLLRKELTQVREEAKEPAQKIEQLEGQAASAGKAPPPQTGGHMVFFRGGYVGLMEPRTGEVLTDLGTGANKNDSGWYVGTGFDFLLSDDVWGLWKSASIFAGLGVEYKNFGTRSQPAALSVLTRSPKKGETELTMLTVSAS